MQGTAQNAPGQTFNPTSQLQRPGLLLLNGVVYAAFGSDCDFNTWQGWVFGVSTAGVIKARWVGVPNGNGAGIWQSGAGLFSDGPNSLMVSTGNTGAPTSATPGKTPPNTFGESIVHLAVQPNGELKPIDFFAPFDAQALDQNDADFASGGITGLNDEYFGTLSARHLAVAVGKDGYVYLLNREDLGGYLQGPGNGDKVVQRIGPNGGVWSRPGVWPGNGGWVYIPTASAGNSRGRLLGLPARLPVRRQRGRQADAVPAGDLLGLVGASARGARDHLRRHDLRLRARVDGVDAERHRHRRAAARVRPGAGERQTGAALERARSAPARSSRPRGSARTNCSSATAKAKCSPSARR